MKKIIQFLLIIILLLILSSVIIFFFNPMNLRNKIVGSMINYYFQVESLEQTGQANNKVVPQPKGTIVETDKNPLLSEEQEAKLESFGIDVEALPKEITVGMTTCFIEKLGAKRADEIVAGATPSPLEILKTKECLSK